MSKRWWYGLAVVGCASAAVAQDKAADADKPDVDAANLRDYVRRLEQRVADLERDKSDKDWPLDQVRTQSKSALEEAVRSVELTGRLEFEYSYNFRHGGATAGGRGDTLNFNQLRGPDADENGFSFTELELVADKPLAAVGSTGFHVSTDFGIVARQADADPNFDGGPGANAFDVREAYLQWRAPFAATDHLDVAVGKFRSPIGYEAFGGYGLNWLVTRNPINLFGTPTTHTGARATAPLSDTIASTVYLVNGWDEVRDANDGKNVIWSTAFGKYDWLSSTVTVNLSYGSIEGVGARQGDKRALANVIWNGNLRDDLEFALDTVVGHQPGRRWHGAAAYLKQKLGDKMSLAVRGGWYADDALGTNGARIVDGSIALGYDVAKDMTVALEYRHDFSRSDGTFLSASGGAAKNQDTLTAAFVYRF